MESFLTVLKGVGATAIAQLSGPKAWLATVVFKVVIFFLDYFKVKHDLKKQFEEKLKTYELDKANALLTEKEKDESLDNFLK
jgi:hypothetical protein